jgi:two-component system sensor histidine kinase BaeS
VDVFAPVISTDEQLLGIIRLSYRYTTVTERLIEIRSLIGLILTFGAILSAALGFFLALNIDRPIERVSQAIFDLAHGVRADPLPVQGPVEAQLLQQAANNLLSRLQDMERSRRRLLANLVHELGRPLGGLYAGIKVLQRGAKADPQVLDELLGGMERETLLLQRLLDDLSHLHDQVIGGLEMDFRKVELSQWLPGVLHPAQEAALVKGLKWKNEIAPDLPAMEIDPQRLAQAVGNLIGNAIKYTPKGGSIMLTAGHDENQFWVRVCDTGPGIPKEEQQKIFEPFFRGSQEKRIKQGLGLGLSIAHDLVAAHQGRLEVESLPSQGSCFTIWLPLEKDRKVV